MADELHEQQPQKVEPRHEVIATLMNGHEITRCLHANTTDVTSVGVTVARLCLDCDEQLKATR